MTKEPNKNDNDNDKDNEKNTRNNCHEMEKVYSIIAAVRKCAWFDKLANTREIITELGKQKDEVHTNEMPSTLTVERTLKNIHTLKPESLHKMVRDRITKMEEFLSPDNGDGYARKDLTLFQIFSLQGEPDGLKLLSLDKNTRVKRFCLGYRFDPRQLNLYEPPGEQSTEAKYFEDLQRQISARWQFVLDSILDAPHLNQMDAASLHKALCSTCTLGEIYDHVSSAKDRESIDFYILSQLVADLHSTQKHQTAHRGISCLEITMGEYTADSFGALGLTSGREIVAYPILTRFFREHYYLAVAIPNENGGYSCEYLRIDRVMKCARTKAHPVLPRDMLPNPPAIEEFLDGSIYRHYTVTACPTSTLNEMVDLFGKNSLSKFSKKEDGWRFEIRIPASREKLLKALHDEKYIREWKSDKETRSSASASYSWNSLIDELRQVTSQLKAYRFQLRKLPPWDLDEFSASAKALVMAIQNQDRNQVIHLLRQQEETLTPIEAAWCCYLGMTLDAETYYQLLQICPAANTFTSLLSATAPTGSREGVHLNLVSVATVFDRVDILKLLIEFGASTDAARDGDVPALHVAIREGAENCLQYLLSAPDVNKTVTEDLLRVFAHAAANGSSAGKGYEIAAPVLLGCSVTEKGFSPFPEGMTLQHILDACNLNLLMQYCALYGDSIGKEQAQQIMNAFPWFAMVEEMPEAIVNIMSVLVGACPSILLTSQCKYLLAVAGLQKGPMPEKLPALLKRIRDPHIMMPDYTYHNWFGRDGMIHRWDKNLNHPAIGRKSPLIPAIDRNTPPPCAPDAITTEVMDIILTKFKVFGKVKNGELSVLARYALKFASRETIERDMQSGDLLPKEDPEALKIYVENLRDSTSMDAYQRDMLLNLLNKE